MFAAGHARLSRILLFQVLQAERIIVERLRWLGPDRRMIINFAAKRN
jgi:hypothetical protein